MDPREHGRVAAVQGDHWWYRTTRGLLSDLLADRVRPTDLVLDVGCGTGATGAWLADLGTVVGVDLTSEALTQLRRSHAAVAPVRADAAELPFGDHEVDHVVAVNVLYTVADDRRVIAEVARVLRPGGSFLAMEPAAPALRRAHDRLVHARRRYRRGQLEALVTGTGFTIERRTHAFAFLVPPAAALAVLDRVRPQTEGDRSDVDRRSLDALFAPLAAQERRWLRGHRLAIGTSLVILATASRQRHPRASGRP
jgi:SAM-dependent methyltransferase